MKNPDFQPGMTVSVHRRRCQQIRGEFVVTPEDYTAVVVRVGNTGMVYVRRASGAPGVIHNQECTPQQ